MNEWIEMKEVEKKRKKTQFIFWQKLKIDREMDKYREGGRLGLNTQHTQTFSPGRKIDRGREGWWVGWWLVLLSSKKNGPYILKKCYKSSWRVLLKLNFVGKGSPYNFDEIRKAYHLINLDRYVCTKRKKNLVFLGKRQPNFFHIFHVILLVFFTWDCSIHIRYE